MQCKLKKADVWVVEAKERKKANKPEGSVKMASEATSMTL